MDLHQRNFSGQYWGVTLTCIPNFSQIRQFLRKLSHFIEIRLVGWLGWFASSDFIKFCESTRPSVVLFSLRCPFVCNALPQLDSGRRFKENIFLRSRITRVHCCKSSLRIYAVSLSLSLFLRAPQYLRLSVLSLIFRLLFYIVKKDHSFLYLSLLS